MKNASLSVLLWVVSTAITASIILFIQAGKGVAIEYSLVSGLAILGWRLHSSVPTVARLSIVPHYIGSIVSLLVLSTFRYAAHYESFVHAHYPNLLQLRYTDSYAHWFLVQVCLPVSLLLTGGYCLSRHRQAGLFFAWWGFLLCTAESLIQFVVELTHLDQYAHVYFLGILTAMVQFVISVSGLLQLSKANEHSAYAAPIKPMTNRQINRWSLLFISLVVVYAATLFTQAGPLPVGVIMGSMAGGLLGWRKTTARRPVDPLRTVPLYLLLQALFYVHVGEEVLTHFNRSIASLSGHAWDDTEFNYLITLVGPAIWVLAAYSLWKGQAFGNFILWFMIVGMIVGEPTHVVVFPVVRMLKEDKGYEYFSGMYTALFPMIPAILLLVLILRDHRKWNRHTHEAPV